MINLEKIENSVIQFQPQSTAPLSADVVSKRIQNHLNTVSASSDAYSTYLFPMSALTAEQALKYDVSTGEQVYGAIVPTSTHQADKAMLHELVKTDAMHPDWYLPKFAQDIKNNVIPGFTVFSNDDALTAYKLLYEKGFSIRAKDPSANGGGRQVLLSSKEELDYILTQYDNISRIGLVLEANTESIINMPTVGQVNLLGNRYSWISHNFSVIDKSALRFGGTTMHICLGTHHDLLGQFDFSEEDKKAIEDAVAVIDQYKSSNIRVGRCALDIIQGISNGKHKVGGVVDPSLRPSASSVAEIKGIEQIHESKKLNCLVKLSFLYDSSYPIPKNSEVALDHKKLRIITEVIS